MHHLSTQVNSMAHSGAVLLQDLRPLLAAGKTASALEELRAGLTRLRAEWTPREWREFCVETHQFQNHPVGRLLKECPLAGGSGLIHEPLILDLIYGLELNAVKQAKQASDECRTWELSLGFCRSLRARHQSFSRELLELGHCEPAANILAIGCGYLREAAGLLRPDGPWGGRLVAFDRDRACVDLIVREYDQKPGLRTASGSLRELLRTLAEGTFDFIYVPTLFDTLPDGRVTVVLAALLRLLKSGGRLLATYFAPDLQDRAYMEACLDWWPFYRTEEDLARLLPEETGRQLRGQLMFRDEGGGSVFLDLQAQ
jgi:extracellular factor (EF) 3-hydroxypalmitic acid methyl ester biosynthesis protein